MATEMGSPLAGGLRALGVLALFLVAAPLSAQEDDTRREWWPEVDAYVGLNERSRLFFLATSSRNRGEDLREGMVGAHADLFLKPFGRPWLARSPDAVKRHYMVFRAGYRYFWDMTGSSGYWEHRMLLEGTARHLERDLGLGSRVATPYVMAEFYYDSRYDAWNRQRYLFGIEWPIGKRPVLDTCYWRQNDSRSSVAHVDAVGLALNLFF